MLLQQRNKEQTKFGLSLFLIVILAVTFMNLEIFMLM